MKRYKAPVTIIIAIKCKEGIVIACDSRTSDLATGIGRDDAKKLHVVKFNDGNEAILAEAGNATYASLAVEMIMNRAATIGLTDYRTLADCARAAIEEVKRQIREQYIATAAELQRHFFENCGFELLLAHYFKGVQYVFTVEFSQGCANKQDRKIISTGCGKELADFLILTLGIDGDSIGDSLWNSAFVIEEVKKYDIRCGGPTQAAIVRTENGVSRASPSTAGQGFEDGIKAVQEFAAEQKSKWSQTVFQGMKKAVAKWQSAASSEEK